MPPEEKGGDGSVLEYILKRIKKYLTLVTAIIGLILGLFALKRFQDHPYAFHLSIALYVLILLLFVVAIVEGYIIVRDQKRQKELEIYSKKDFLKDPEYYRTRPYEEGEEFSRPDQFENRVFDWITKNDNNRILYLTGDSGVGKSSILNAALKPKLEALGTPYKIILLRAFDRPDEQLRKELLKLWDRPQKIHREAPLYELLTMAAERLSGLYLLIIFDQFEELSLLYEKNHPSTSQLEILFNKMRQAGAPGNATILLCYRNDYQILLDDRDLGGDRRERDNWLDVPRFNIETCLQFFENSGQNLKPEIIKRLIEEAQIIEGGRGVIRPIVVNMLGLCLLRYPDKIIERKKGALLTYYIREALYNERNPSQLFGEAICKEMITVDGTKRPQRIAELNSKTGISKSKVKGTLVLMAKEGLARRLLYPHADPQGNLDDETRSFVWEISHDFIASLIAQILKLGKTNNSSCPHLVGNAIYHLRSNLIGGYIS